MKQIVCEMCGGKELIKQDGVFVCQNCGTKYSVEEAKKMMVETEAPAKLENALKNARRAMENKNYEQAEKYYNIVQMEEPENWEANFYSIYSKAMRTNLMNISQAAYSITNSIKTVFKDIKKLDDTIQQNEAIKQISTDLSAIATEGYNLAINFYNSQMNTYGNNSFFASAISDVKLTCANNILPFANMLTFFGRELVSEFGGNEFTNLINIQCHEMALKITNDLYKSADERFLDSNSVDFLQKYTDELKKIKPLPELLDSPEKKSSSSLDSFATSKKTVKSFLTKPLAPNGCGCGCLPAFFTTPIFIIVFVAIVIIGAIITPEESQTQNVSNRKSNEQIKYETRAMADILYGDLKDANTMNSRECFGGKPIQLRGSIENVNASYVDIKPNIRAFFVCNAVSCNEIEGKNLKKGEQIRFAGECQGQKDNKLIIRSVVIVD